VWSFWKESDIFLTSDTWRIALDFNLSTYYEVIYTVKADIFSVEKQKLEFTSFSEFRQIETQLQILECKHNDFYQFLPRLDRRRSILGVGGTILRTYSEPQLWQILINCIALLMNWKIMTLT